MPEHNPFESAVHIRTKSNPGNRELKRKKHLPVALSTLFKHIRAPPSDRDTFENSEIVQKRLAQSHESAQGIIWPPDGLTYRSHLAPEDAGSILCKGALRFEGFTCLASHTSRQHMRFFAFAETPDGKYPLSGYYHVSGELSLVLGRRLHDDHPWETLEQPSMSLCFGCIPGSITLNRYISFVGSPLVNEQPRTLTTPKDMCLQDVLDRLDCLQHGLDDDLVFAQKYLLHTLLFAHSVDSTHPPDIERQVQLLIEALNSPRWFDFRQPRYQITAALLFNETPMIAEIFYHQLMLSMQLFLNIRDSGLSQNRRTFLFHELPEQVAWSVAFAQLWEENCRIAKLTHETEDPILGPYAYGLIFRNRSCQVERLVDFARSLNWPCFSRVVEDMEACYRKLPNGERSMELMTWLSGLVLPGNSLPWIIMAALLACDREIKRSLKTFTFFLPNFGFQHCLSTYWYWECIIAKVMAAADGVNQSTGWVGPVYLSPSLEEDECVLVNQYEAPYRLNKRSVKSMKLRSDPLGPAADDYPVREYSFPRLSVEAVRSIQLQRLEVKDSRFNDVAGNSLYDSCVHFSIAGFFSSQIPVRLRYNVDFIAAVPCHSGPHVLYHGYNYQVVSVDSIWRLNFWGGGCVCPLDRKGKKCRHRLQYPSHFEDDKILVIRAFGPADNDVFARAWCSYMGLSAVVASNRMTCVACAIRNAYAACVSVLIMVGGKEPEDRREDGRESSPPQRKRHRSRNSMYARH